MNKFGIACLIGLSAATFTTLPAAASTLASHSRYCRNYATIGDPMCMSSKMRKRHMTMNKVTMHKFMANHSRYCRNYATVGDPMCTKKMMHSTMSY
jgi:hypothetical protein